MRRPLALALALLAVGFAGPPERYEVAPESRFWIDGTATTGAWSCAADAVAGSARLGATLAGRVSVPVRAFDCGSRPMTRDLHGALRAEAHPEVRFELASAEVVGAGADAWVRVRAAGTLRLAGAARPLAIEAEGRRLADGRVALRGRHALRMSDFGVAPPSHAFGLVRAHDAVVVRFDLVAVPR